MLSFKPKYNRIIIAASSDSDVSEEHTDTVRTVIDMPAGNDRKMSRKRKRNPENWKRNKVKVAREKGHSYVDSAGKTVPEKTSACGKNLCSSGCRFKCNEHVSDENRSIIFEKYHELTGDAQNVYLFGCMIVKNPQRVCTEASQHRDVVVQYTVRTGNDVTRVCKKAFMQLHSISQAKVDHIVQQAKSGIPTARPSCRGKHSNRPNNLELVREHIRLFPAEMSHYSRTGNPHRMYLSPSLTVNKMYHEYVKWATEKEAIPVSSAMYRTVFCNDFNLAFGSPRTDTCGRCETLSGDILVAHKADADSAFNQQKIDRDSARAGTISYVTFDLQKTLPLPKLSVGEAFYLRQIWLYNLGVHLVQKEREGAYFHIWSEGEGRRGVQEVCSALLTFFELTTIGDGTTTLVAWSDSCAGQNKNFQMIAFWQYLMLTGQFVSIEHKFPIPGHSFLDSDRDFAKIEGEVKRRENIYSMDEYQSLMTSCIRKPQPTVTRLGDKMFDIKSLIRKLRLVKKTRDVNGNKVDMRDKVRWIRVTQFGRYEYKHSFDDSEEWKEVMLCGHTVEMPVIEMLSQARVPVAPAKLQYIQKQLKYIPATHQGFYKNLCASEERIVSSESEVDALEVVDTTTTEALSQVSAVIQQY